jgi:putative ABC transport system ATP-binding protein
MEDSQATQDNKIAVRCHGVTKVYGAGEAAVAALRGGDLEVRRGELLMLVGLSGCGKTTLISVIAGILDRDAGECEVLGHDPQLMDRSERAHFRGTRIGFVFQAFNLFAALTVAENIAIPLLINGVAHERALARATELLATVGMGGRTRALPAQLSGGEQQRVAMARALVHDPKLIFCDEPTSNLDRETGQNMMEILRGVARSPDRALVVVTHDARIFAFADRVARMEDGKIIEVRGAGQAETLQ